MKMIVKGRRGRPKGLTQAASDPQQLKLFTVTPEKREREVSPETELSGSQPLKKIYNGSEPLETVLTATETTTTQDEDIQMK